jgi:hypothetical protein
MHISLGILYPIIGALRTLDEMFFCQRHLPLQQRTILEEEQPTISVAFHLISIIHI